MHNNSFTGHVRLALAFGYLCAMINNTTAGSFARGCAVRDLQILMLIEEREDSNSVSAERPSDAMLLMLEARIVCHEGHVTDAMALYENIAQDITSDTFLSAQRK